GRLRREPAAHVRTRPLRRTPRLEAVEAPARVAELVLEREQVVLPRLDVDEEAVERGDVDAGRVEAGLERLHERRPRPGERIEHVLPRDEVAPEQRLDQLRDELAEVRME